MGPIAETSDANGQVNSLQSEVQNFLDNLPQWSKFLCSKILSSQDVSDEYIDEAFEIFMESEKLSPLKDRLPIELNYSSATNTSFKANLLLSKIQKIEGVNALSENQTLEFGPNITVFFGANGSGKSGYIRLLKKAFFSRATSHIFPNININSGHKEVKADFYFRTGGADYLRSFPSDGGNGDFQQFAVFDNNCAPVHLSSRNGFEFRPIGLSIFGDLIQLYKRLENKLSSLIISRSTKTDFTILFEGNSETKELLANLDSSTNIQLLRDFSNVSEEASAIKIVNEAEYDKIKLDNLNREQEVQRYKVTIEAFRLFKTQIEKVNGYFNTVTTTRINNRIADFLAKTALATKEGIANFQSEFIFGIGNDAWRNFIQSASIYAIHQDGNYPKEGDKCLLCQQDLSEKSQELISNYWSYLKSEAEKQAKESLKSLDEVISAYNNARFSILEEGSLVYAWLKQNENSLLEYLVEHIANKNQLLAQIAEKVVHREAILEAYELIDPSGIDTIIGKLIDYQKSLIENAHNPRLEELKNAITSVAHRQKLSNIIDPVVSYVQNLSWLESARTASASFGSRWITNLEKQLSERYFNQKYYELFSDTCEALHGNFGVEIAHTGSLGTSYRQLKLKNNSPSDILSEGEQKVIALADFISEMKISENNKGIIFDDPVTSLDNDRKKYIAETLVKESRNRQVIIFTHDLVFYNCLSNASKVILADLPNCFLHHTITKENPKEIGKVILHYSPASQSHYKDARKAKDFLAKSQSTTQDEQLNNIKSGYSALRTSYEYLISHTITGAVVQRFDPQIRVGRLKDIKFDKDLIDRVVTRHGEISDFIEGHLPADEVGISPTPESLNIEIIHYETLVAAFKAL